MRRWFLVSLLLTVAAGWAAETPDPRVKTLLDRAEIAYEVDEDNDYKVLVTFGEQERSQLVYIISNTHTTEDLEVRELWSYAYLSENGAVPAEVADRLMQASRDQIIGAWEMDAQDERRVAVLVYKLPATISVEAFRSAVLSIASVADEMEKDLTGTDDF